METESGTIAWIQTCTLFQFGGIWCSSFGCWTPLQILRNVRSALFPSDGTTGSTVIENGESSKHQGRKGGNVSSDCSMVSERKVLCRVKAQSTCCSGRRGPQPFYCGEVRGSSLNVFASVILHLGCELGVFLCFNSLIRMWSGTFKPNAPLCPVSTAIASLHNVAWSICAQKKEVYRNMHFPPVNYSPQIQVFSFSIHLLELPQIGQDLCTS